MSIEPPAPLKAAFIKESTKVGYIKAVMAAISHSRGKRTVDRGDPPIPSMAEVVQDLLEREDITRGTKITARSALLWYIKSGQVDINSETLEGLAMLEGMTEPSGHKPAVLRRKVISEDDLAKLMKELYLRAQKSIWARRCAVWIRAGLATGARPSEWLHAHWADSEKTVLRIRSAKGKLLAPAFLRKAAGKLVADSENSDYWDPGCDDSSWLEDYYLKSEESFREVPVLGEFDRSWIDAHFEFIKAFMPGALMEREMQWEFKKYHDACALVLRRACSKIWNGKRTYTLYTMRGQFSANMKAAYGVDQTAEWMGHASADSPATGYYGKGNQAHRRFKGLRAHQRNDQAQEHARPRE